MLVIRNQATTILEIIGHSSFWQGNGCNYQIAVSIFPQQILPFSLLKIKNFCTIKFTNASV